MRQALLLVLLLGCLDPDAPPPTGDGGVTTCTNDAVCDDDAFCTGVERCEPTSPDADAFGCVRGDVPCEGTCDERIDACLSCDADGDGFESFACGGTDCDDTDANVNPEATEVCDPEQRDEDCDPTTFGDLDVDGDGVVDALCCNLDLCGADCDDTDASVRPGAPEVCNRRDDDCDDSIDEDASMPGFVDEDSDGRGDGARPTMGCAGAPRFSTVGDDCDDADPARNPAQVEVCDGVDNDCDDRLDENARAVPWYPDRDADEYGDPGAEPVMRCGTPAGHVLNDLDCDDTLADVHPGATERCNGRDDDCDGVARFEGVLEDRDGDGATSCGAVVDCDDTDPRVGLGAPERCNGADDDCDGHVDENAEDVAWFPDFDRDGYGSGEGVSTCNPPASYVSRDGDCAPSRAEVNPGAAERCDGVDQDCDGRVDEDAERICRASGAVCREGRCEVVECASGAVCDVDGGGTECIDVAVHGDHCGGCDLQCPSGQLCQDAECGGWDEVDLGAYPNCARAGGRVYCWGRVSGSGVEPPPGNFMRPQTVVGVDDALTVEAGGDHACVLRTGGEAWCFGLNYYGQLGDGTAEPRLAPTRVATSLRFREVSAGLDATCARAEGAGPVAEDTVYCWGNNEYGVSRPSLSGPGPNRPTRLSETLLADRLDVGSDHACALSDGSLWCWGTNTHGQLGAADVGTRALHEPREVFAGTDTLRVTHVAVGDGHTCLVTDGPDESGVVRCLGRHDWGQAGGAPGACTGCLGTQHCLDGACVGGGFECTTGCGTDRYCVEGSCVPFQTTPRDVFLSDGVSRLDEVVELDAGDRHTCALRVDGSVWCWGRNQSGELARDDLVVTHSQVALRVEPRWTGTAVALSVGRAHACIRTEAGAVWCWGSNASNENGTGVPYTIVARPLLAPVR